jgi:hypothetical protein
VGAILIAAVYIDQQRRAAVLRGGGRPRMNSLLNHLITSRQTTPARELPRTPRSAQTIRRALMTS